MKTEQVSNLHQLLSRDPGMMQQYTEYPEPGYTTIWTRADRSLVPGLHQLRIDIHDQFNSGKTTHTRSTQVRQNIDRGEIDTLVGWILRAQNGDVETTMTIYPSAAQITGEERRYSVDTSAYVKKPDYKYAVHADYDMESGSINKVNIAAKLGDNETFFERMDFYNDRPVEINIDDLVARINSYGISIFADPLDIDKELSPAAVRERIAEQHELAIIVDLTDGNVEALYHNDYVKTTFSQWFEKNVTPKLSNIPSDVQELLWFSLFTRTVALCDVFPEITVPTTSQGAIAVIDRLTKAALAAQLFEHDQALQDNKEHVINLVVKPEGIEYVIESPLGDNLQTAVFERGKLTQGRGILRWGERSYVIELVDNLLVIESNRIVAQKHPTLPIPQYMNERIRTSFNVHIPTADLKNELDGPTHTGWENVTRALPVVSITHQ